MNRNEYLESGRDATSESERREIREAAHRTYYGQFVTDSVRAAVLARFSVATLREAFREDSAFNTSATPLPAWDQIAAQISTRALGDAMRERGDYPTMGGLVCLAKEAARQIIESEGGEA